ncbi:hypothetical protein PMAYCL1PPCAC_17628, partial [Pristionchus mayeri]
GPSTLSMIVLLVTTSLLLPSISSFAVDSIESCFVFFPNRYLEKSGNSFLTNLTNARECQHRCLTTRLKNGLACKSAMWKRDTEDCVLSRYNRFDRYDSYRIAPNLEIDYYENICIGKEKLVNRDTEQGVESVEVREERTTVPPIEKMYQPKRRSIGSSPQYLHRVDDAPLHFEKRIIRPGPINSHHFRGTSAPSTTTEKTTTMSTTTTTTRAPTTTTTTTARPHPPPPPPPPPMPLPDPAALISESTMALKPHDCFTRKPNVVFKGFEEATLLNLSVSDCLQRCIDETKFHCASVNYELTRQLCVLNGGSSSLNGMEVEAAMVDYYENGCPPKETTSTTSFVGETRSECFHSQQGKALLDLGGELLTTASLDACMAECSREGRPSLCSAINWLPQSKTCMIYSPGYTSSVVSHPTASFHTNECPVTASPLKSTPSDYDYH